MLRRDGDQPPGTRGRAEQRVVRCRCRVRRYRHADAPRTAPRCGHL